MPPRSLVPRYANSVRRKEPRASRPIPPAVCTASDAQPSSLPARPLRSRFQVARQGKGSCNNSISVPRSFTTRACASVRDCSLPSSATLWRDRCAATLGGNRSSESHSRDVVVCTAAVLPYFFFARVALLERRVRGKEVLWCCDAVVEACVLDTQSTWVIESWMGERGDGRPIFVRISSCWPSSSRSFTGHTGRTLDAVEADASTAPPARKCTSPRCSESRLL
ncbi:hypothetical protein BJ546DRAFT_368867 [Cryomyces antarcticus]